MLRLARSPPVAWLALAVGAGATLSHLGVHPLWMVPFLPILLVPNDPSPRPNSRWISVLLGLTAGFASTQSGKGQLSQDCRLNLPEGKDLTVHGLLVGPLVDGRGEILPTVGFLPGCRSTLRVVVPDRLIAERRLGEGARAGDDVAFRGRWRRTPAFESADPKWAGYLQVTSVPDPVQRLGLLESAGPLARVRYGVTKIGGWVQGRLVDLFPRTAPLATALVWARKDRLSPEVREAFARAGTAHLLAISGFHVGVVGGLLLLLLGFTGLSHRVRILLASAGVWAYVLAIGVPDAAFRAAALLTVLALGRILNRSVAPLGAVATAFLLFLALDPIALRRPGFQLSFAGAVGLLVGYRAVREWILTKSGGKVPQVVVSGVAAGVSATLATLPLVAWHFGRVSVVGIPVTLVVAPLVALAIPGIFLSLVISTLHQGLGRFFASGVEMILQVIGASVAWAGSLPFSSIWVSEATVIACTVALGVCLLLTLLRLPGSRVTRTRLTVISLACGLWLGPPGLRLLETGGVELVVLDVGQGDATLLKSPAGRWILIDAGPRTRSFDAGERRVLPFLRRRGVGRLHLMILTHPDMDHVGGARAVLDAFPVDAVMDPGMATGTDAFLGALQSAKARGVPWYGAEAGDSLHLDGMIIRVLAPDESGRAGELDGANGASLVLEVRYGEFSMLLTGDAPEASEALFLRRLLSPRVHVLKVGHHGSSTSTSPDLVLRAGFEVALISVGQRNRFGHPHPDVLARLSRAGAKVLRTDRHGSLTVRGKRDGSYSLSQERK